MKKLITKIIKEKKANLGVEQLVIIAVVLIVFSVILAVFMPYLKDTFLPHVLQTITNFWDWAE